MASDWPWLAAAGIGALHGLNPTSGWMLAAACGVRSGDRTQPLRALFPIALGHIASIALVAAAVWLGASMNRFALQILAGVLLAVVTTCRLLRRSARGGLAPSGHTGLALWSFIMSTGHGAGLMLVPVLIPLCAGGAPGRDITASGSLGLALAAVGVHTGAMLVVTGVVAMAACRAFDAGSRLLRRLWQR
jgi:hypothetical protein